MVASELSPFFLYSCRYIPKYKLSVYLLYLDLPQCSLMMICSIRKKLAMTSQLRSNSDLTTGNSIFVFKVQLKYPADGSALSQKFLSVIVTGWLNMSCSSVVSVSIPCVGTVDKSLAPNCNLKLSLLL